MRFLPPFLVLLPSIIPLQDGFDKNPWAFFSASWHSCELVVNEIHYAPTDTELEFVELYNCSEKALALHLLQFSDNRLEPVAMASAPQWIAPGAYAVLVRNGSVFSQAFPGIPFIEPTQWPALNNTGDAVVLYRDGAILDQVVYEPGWGGTSGVSLERIDPQGPSDSRFNFGSSTAFAGATPGMPNSLYHPDTTPPHPYFAEQTYPDALSLFFDEPLDQTSLPSAIFRLENGTTPISTTLSEDATRLTLGFSSALAGPSLHLSGLQDLTGNTLRDTTVTLAYQPQRRDLILNEILYAPRSDRYDGLPDQPEYVELLNTSDRLISLHGLYWTNQVDEKGEADTLKTGSALLGIAPGHYVVFFANGSFPDTPPSETRLGKAFPTIGAPPTTTHYLPLPRTTLGLSNAGDLFVLHRADDAILDSLAYHPSWHHPHLTHTTGYALERLSPELDSARRSSWTSSVAVAGGTPGFPNSVTPSAAMAISTEVLSLEPSPFSPDRDGVDDVVALRYALTHDGSILRVRIFDTQGRLVRSLRETLAGRTGSLFWDGLDDAGGSLPIGVYVILFEAHSPDRGKHTVIKKPVVLARPLR